MGRQRVCFASASVPVLQGTNSGTGAVDFCAGVGSVFGAKSAWACEGVGEAVRSEILRERLV